MLKIWGRRTAFNVQKVLWLVGELGIEYENIVVGGSYRGLDTPDFLTINPHGRIPVIKDTDTVVWESHAILRYLAAQYSHGQFWAEEAKVRAQADQWMDWSQTTLQPDFLNGVFLGFYRTPEADRNWVAIRESIKRCSQHFQLLNRILENRTYLGGTAMSLADITAGIALYRYFELDIERPNVPNVEAWYKQLQNRPAFRENVMVSFEEMKGRLTL